MFGGHDCTGRRPGLTDWPTDERVLRILAIAAGVLGASWRIVAEVRRRRRQSVRERNLRSTLPGEAEEDHVARLFASRYRRYQAALVACIVGFVLVGISAIPGSPGVVSLVAIPMLLLGCAVGVQVYKCPRCGGHPASPWSLQAPDNPERCARCGVRLR